jgi:hypothetical protein
MASIWNCFYGCIWNAFLYFQNQYLKYMVISTTDKSIGLEEFAGNANPISSILVLKLLH